jgi:hypothetical protein
MFGSESWSRLPGRVLPVAASGPSRVRVPGTSRSWCAPFLLFLILAILIRQPGNHVPTLPCVRARAPGRPNKPCLRAQNREPALGPLSGHDPRFFGGSCPDKNWQLPPPRGPPASRGSVSSGGWDGQPLLLPELPIVCEDLSLVGRFMAQASATPLPLPTGSPSRGRRPSETQLHASVWGCDLGCGCGWHTQVLPSA